MNPDRVRGCSARVGRLTVNSLAARPVEPVEELAQLSAGMPIQMSRKARSSLMAEGFTPAELDRHRPRVWLLPFWWRRKYITLSEAATGTCAAIPDPVLMVQREFDAAMLVIKDHLVKLKGRLPALMEDFTERTD